MLTQKIQVGETNYSIILTDQVINQVSIIKFTKKARDKTNIKTIIRKKNVMS